MEFLRRIQFLRKTLLSAFTDQSSRKPVIKKRGDCGSQSPLFRRFPIQLGQILEIDEVEKLTLTKDRHTQVTSQSILIGLFVAFHSNDKVCIESNAGRNDPTEELNLANHLFNGVLAIGRRFSSEDEVRTLILIKEWARDLIAC